MKDNVSKQKGLPYSTSRGQERKNKHNTIKARRQDARRVIGRAELDEREQQAEENLWLATL